MKTLARMIMVSIFLLMAAPVSADLATHIVLCEQDYVTVDLFGVEDVSCFSIALAAISDLDGNLLEGDTDIHIRVLLGDANGDGTVDVLDMSKVKGWLFNAVTPENASADLTGDGSINALDMSAVKGNLFNAVSCP